MIRFVKATVTYPGGVHALKGLDLEIDDGEMLVIVGLSGAGKCQVPCRRQVSSAI